jgi:phosphoglycolate phosphatase-like HAD superfamily hydrolase
MPPACTCVLFDFDDTLAVSRPVPTDGAETAAPWLRLRGRELCLIVPDTGRHLAVLADQGISLGIVTASPTGVVAPALRQWGLWPVFADCLVTADRCRARKPSPVPVRMALRLLGRTAAEALLIGDSPDDAAAALAAGVRFARAGWSPRPFPESDCHPAYGSLRELVEDCLDARLGEPML